MGTEIGFTLARSTLSTINDICRPLATIFSVCMHAARAELVASFSN